MWRCACRATAKRRSNLFSFSFLQRDLLFFFRFSKKGFTASRNSSASAWLARNAMLSRPTSSEGRRPFLEIPTKKKQIIVRVESMKKNKIKITLFKDRATSDKGLAFWLFIFLGSKRAQTDANGSYLSFSVAAHLFRFLLCLAKFSLFRSLALTIIVQWRSVIAVFALLSCACTFARFSRVCWVGALNFPLLLSRTLLGTSYTQD